MNVQSVLDQNKDLFDDHSDVADLLKDFSARYPQLEAVLPDILNAYRCLLVCFENECTLFVCGNGGSFADALHISSELMKSFLRKRPLKESLYRKLVDLPYGDELSTSLESGFRVVPLGLNISLTSALENDLKTRYLTFAQELSVLSREGDVLFGISTSGNARNVGLAFSVAKANGLKTICLTGRVGGLLANEADFAIRVPQDDTFKIQEYHVAVYHLLCAMVEVRWFKIHK